MKVLYTSALIPNKFEERRIEYQNSYYELKNYFDSKDIYVIECFSNKIDFLSDFGSPSYLTNTHDTTIRNKGVLELKGIYDFLIKNKIEDEYVLKITGRYVLCSDYFLKKVTENSGYDFYGKLIDGGIQVFTGCFIIKKELLLSFIENQDFDHLERDMINIEMALLDFLNSKNKRCLFLDKLDVHAPIFGTGNVEVHYV